MANEVRDNVEFLLMNAINDYLKLDRNAVYSNDIKRATKVFSPNELMALDLMLRTIEDYMYNLIFLTNQDLKPIGNELNLTELISVIKAEEAYKFARKGQRTIIFDTICKEDTNYEDFDIELNQFFEKPKAKVHK